MTENSLGPFLKNKFGDVYLHAVNGLAFNQIDSDTVYRKYFGKEFQREDHFHVVVGTDSGLLLTWTLKKGIPKGARFLFIELPNVLERIKEIIPLDDLEQRVVVATPDDWQELLAQMGFEEYVYIDEVTLKYSLAAADACLAEYLPLRWQVHQQLERQMWAIKVDMGCEPFTIRQLENLAELQTSSQNLKGLFKGKTAVLLGGGPSLDAALPWIIENRHSIVVLAVSRVSRRLLEVDLPPHLIFSVDPQMISFDVSREMFHFWDKSVFVHCHHVTSPLLGQWRGRCVFSGSRFPWETPLNVPTLPIAGPTVTNFALATAIEMGFAQILLTGVDLCFSKEGYCHAQGSYEHQAGPKVATVCPSVETNGGWFAETTPAYAAAIDDMAGQAEFASSRDCRVINLSEGAAKIPNITYQPVAEISIEALTEPAEELLARAMPSLSSAERKDFYQQALTELRRAKSQLLEIRKLAEEGLRCNDGLFGRNGMTADFRFKRRMDAVQKRLDVKFGDFKDIIKKFGKRRFLGMFRPSDNEEWSDEEIERIGRVYYESYRDSANELRGLLDGVKQRLEARLEEEKDTPDFIELDRQYRLDGQPGRILAWKERHQVKDEELSPDDLAIVRNLEEAFDRVLTEPPPKVRLLGVKAIETLAGAAAKGRVLFSLNDLNGLAVLHDTVEKNGKFPRVASLLRGYRAELEKAPEAALSAYEGVFNDDVPDHLTESALKRIAAISLGQNNIQNALLALECLTGISLVYQPMYADLLKIAGRHKEAIDAYMTYLAAAPEDVGVLLKFGILCRQTNVKDAAQMAFRMVLEKAPDNTAAKKFLQEMTGEAC